MVLQGQPSLPTQGSILRQPSAAPAAEASAFEISPLDSAISVAPRPRRSSLGQQLLSRFGAAAKSLVSAGSLQQAAMMYSNPVSQQDTHAGISAESSFADSVHGLLPAAAASPEHSRAASPVAARPLRPAPSAAPPASMLASFAATSPVPHIPYQMQPSSSLPFSAHLDRGAAASASISKSVSDLQSLLAQFASTSQAAKSRLQP